MKTLGVFVVIAVRLLLLWLRTQCLHLLGDYSGNPQIIEVENYTTAALFKEGRLSLIVCILISTNSYDTPQLFCEMFCPTGSSRKNTNTLWRRSFNLSQTAQQQPQSKCWALCFSNYGINSYAFIIAGSICSFKIIAFNHFNFNLGETQLHWHELNLNIPTDSRCYFRHIPHSKRSNQQRLVQFIQVNTSNMERCPTYCFSFSSPWQVHSDSRAQLK